VSPVSVVRANGVAQLTGYAAVVRIRLAILVTIIASLGGCLGGCLVGCKDHDVERLTGIKRDVCACKDVHCADQAMSEVPKTSIQSTARTRAIARDIMDCRARFEAADRPSTDPDAEDSGSAAPAESPPPAAAAAPATPPKAAR
jgi:hypothetical protein